jgi:hypothetical protein
MGQQSVFRYLSVKFELNEVECSANARTLRDAQRVKGARPCSLLTGIFQPRANFMATTSGHSSAWIIERQASCLSDRRCREDYVRKIG